MQGVRHSGTHQFLRDDRRIGERAAPSAVLDGPVHGEQSQLSEQAVERTCVRLDTVRAGGGRRGGAHLGGAQRSPHVRPDPLLIFE